MAELERGVGISWKLPDGTMVWVKRDDWAETCEEIKIIKGEEYLRKLQAELKGEQVVASVTPIRAPQPMPAPETPMSVESAAEALGATVGQTYQICPRCKQMKDKWVEPGFSKKTNKNYPGFFACPTRGCPGR